MVIQAQFDSCYAACVFKDGIALVIKNNKFGWIDKKGRLAILLDFDDAYPFVNGLAKVRIGERWGMINKKEEFVVAPNYNFIYGFQFTEGLLPVRLGDNDGYIDSLGNMKFTVPGATGELGSFSEGVASASILADKGIIGTFIDNTGQFVIGSYQQTWSFKNGLAPVKLNERVGFIDHKGEFVIKPQFDLAFDFHDDLALVQVGGRQAGKWGFIQTNGKYAIIPKYDSALGFYDGAAPVKYHGRWGMIDTAGNFIVSSNYDDIDYFHDGLAVVKIGG